VGVLRSGCILVLLAAVWALAACRPQRAAAPDPAAARSDDAARLPGFETEADGDVHLVLAPAGGETDTKRWVITEVTPAWQAKDAAMSAAKLRALRGQQVQVTGWLFHEPDADDPDPRGTPWELHPVTAIAVVSK